MKLYYLLAQVNLQPLPHVSADKVALRNLLSIVFGVIGALAVIYIILMGLRFILAQGEPDAAAKARRGIIYASIGLAIALSAEVIVLFVLGSV